MTRHEMIVQAASDAHRKHRKPTSDRAEGNRQAKAVVEEWQKSIQGQLKEVESEMPVGGANERIDVVDLKERVAYEIKASGNNPAHEFYKDVFKALAHNAGEPDVRIKKLVFMTETKGIEVLRAGLGSLACDVVKDNDLEVELIAVP